MSWNVTRMGKKEVIRPLLEADFDAAAKGYTGTEEEQDVLAAKKSALAAVDAFEPQEGNSAHIANALSVKAYGSRSKGYVSMHVDVSGVHLDG